MENDSFLLFDSLAIENQCCNEYKVDRIVICHSTLFRVLLEDECEFLMFLVVHMCALGSRVGRDCNRVDFPGAREAGSESNLPDHCQGS